MDNNKKQLELLEEILKQLQSSDAARRRELEIAEERRSKRDLSRSSSGSSSKDSPNYQSRSSGGNNTLVDSIKNLPDTILKMFTGQAINIPQAVIRQLTGALRPSNIITKPLTTALTGVSKIGDTLANLHLGSDKKSPAAEANKEVVDSIKNSTKETISGLDKQISSIHSLEKSVDRNISRSNELLSKIAENAVAAKADRGDYKNPADYYRDLEDTLGPEGKHKPNEHKSTSKLEQLEREAAHKHSGKLESVGKSSGRGNIFSRTASKLKNVASTVTKSGAKKLGSGISGLFKGASKALFGGLKKALNPMSYVRLSGKIMSLGAKGLLKMIPVIGWIFDIGSLLALVWDPVKKYLYEWAKNNPFATKVVQVLDSIVSPIVEFFKNIEKAVEAVFSGDFSDVKEYLLRSFRGIKDFFKNIGKTAWAFIKPLGIIISNSLKSVGNIFIDMINSMRDSFRKAVNSTIDSVNSHLPSSMQIPKMGDNSLSRFELQDYSLSQYRQDVYDNLPTPPSYASSSDSASLSSGDVPSDYSEVGSADYMGLAMHFESGKDYGAIGKIGELGAFQFDPRYDGFTSLVNGLKKNVNSFSDPADRDLINSLNSSSINSIMSDSAKKARLQKILRSDIGVSLQKSVAESSYLTPQLETAKSIMIGDKSLYDYAMTNPRIKALLFSKALNQTSVLKQLKGRNYPDMNSFLEDLRSASHSTWDKVKGKSGLDSKGIQSLHNRFDQEIAYAKGSGVDYTMPDVSNEVDRFSDSATSSIRDTASSVKEKIFSAADISSLVSNIENATGIKLSNKMNLPNSSNIQEPVDDKSIEKQQLGVLSAMYSSTVETDWGLDTLPYDQDLANLNKGTVV